MLVHLVLQKVDPSTRKAWNLKTSDSDDPPSFEDFMAFLKSRARALEASDSSSPNKPVSKNTGAVKVHAATSATASTSGSIVCPLCKSRHYFSSCPTFVKADVKQRRAPVKQQQRCFNCLSHSHAVRECASKHSCRVCSQKHHTMLHDSSDVKSAAVVAESSPSVTPPTVSTASKFPHEKNSHVNAPDTPSKILRRFNHCLHPHQKWLPPFY